MGKHVGRLRPTWQVCCSKIAEVCNQGRSGPHSLCVRPAYLLEYRWTQTANGIPTCSTRVFCKCVSVVVTRSDVKIKLFAGFARYMLIKRIYKHTIHLTFMLTCLTKHGVTSRQHQDTTHITTIPHLPQSTYLPSSPTST